MPPKMSVSSIESMILSVSIFSNVSDCFGLLLNCRTVFQAVDFHVMFERVGLERLGSFSYCANHERDYELRRYVDTRR